MTHMFVEKKYQRYDFEDLNAYHQNIKLTVEVIPSKFLDTELISEKLHWSSKVPVRYKRNANIGELHRAK